VCRSFVVVVAVGGVLLLLLEMGEGVDASLPLITEDSGTN